MVNINFYSIRKWAYAYMALPVMCFMFFYIDSLYGVCFGIISILVFLKMQRDNKKTERSIEKSILIEKKWIIILIIVAVLWAIFGGQGNLFFQNSDWGVRNAIYRDLIYRKWPVKYPNYNKALVYYISYWLPPATMVKILGKIWPTIFYTQLAFFVGNFFLLLWTAIGIVLVGFLLVSYTGVKNTKRFLWIPFVMVFFSGLDIIGALGKILIHNVNFPTMHIEWWMASMQFSSLTTCLFWVFNQAIIPWIAMLCLLQEKSIRDYVFLGTCVFATGPIPFLGVFVYMVPNAIQLLTKKIKRNDFKGYIKDLFGFSNCFSVFLIIVFILYYTTNLALTEGVAESSTVTIGFLELVPINIKFFIKAVVFLLVEVGVYLLLLYKRNKGNVFYWMSIITSIVALLFKMGTGDDFVMRFSIPTIIVIAAMCAQMLIKDSIVAEKNKSKNKISKTYVALVVCLCIGSMTALSEFARGYNQMMVNGKVALTCDWLVTLNQDRERTDLNFVTYDYEEKFFFKYIAPGEE